MFTRSRRILHALRGLCVLAVAMGLVFVPQIHGKNAPGLAVQPSFDESEQGSGVDPCDYLPDPRGKAKGHDKCPAEGSSAGVARGDFNGDGFADLAVGVPDEDVDAAQDAGAVHVIYGSATGLTEGGGTTGVPAVQVWNQNSAGVDTLARSFERFGKAVASGNFNGDSYSDLAIGVPGEEIGGTFPSTGAVHVLFGSPTGLTTTGDQFWDLRAFADIGVIEFPPGENTEFGAALVWGDFNGDTVGDLAIGIPGAPVFCDFPAARIIGCLVPDAGRVLILYGLNGIGLGTLGHDFILQNHRDNVGTEVGDAAEDSDRFGSVMAAGRVDNDLFDDLVIGVPREDVDFSSNAGMVHLAFGSTNGFPGIGTRSVLFRQGLCGLSPGVCIPGSPTSGNQFGRALAVGDFDGDTLADLAFGTPFQDIGTKSNAGAVYVAYGARITSGLPASVQTAQTWHQNVEGIQDGAARSDHFGEALAAGDFNVDGRSDLAIGVPDEDMTDSNGNLVSEAGAVHIIYGTATGLHEAGDQFFTHGNLGAGRTPQSGDQFGASLTAWNFGRNEFVPPPFFRILHSADLAIGVPGKDVAGVQDAGAISVLYGSGFSRLSATNNQLWHQTTGNPQNSNQAGDQAEARDRFGAVLY